MPRWATASATIASFATQRVVGHDDIYVPLATASVAGAMTPAAFSKVSSWPAMRLVYTLAADTWNGTALTAGSSNDAMAAQNCVANSTSAWLLFILRFSTLFNATGAGIAEVTTYINVDGTQYKIACLGGPNTLWSTADGGALLLNGFSAATHSVKVQIKPNVNGNAFLRAATVTATEFLELTVLELNP